MIKISGREALFAGFRLIRREPIAFLVWCAVCFLLGVAPQMLSFGTMLQSLSAISQGGDPFGPEMMAAQQQAMRFAPVGYLCTFAILALLPPAVMRAMLTPDDRRFFYLRLGAREFWFLIVTLAYLVAYFVAALVTMLPFFLLVGLGAAMTQLGAVGAILMVPLFFIGPIALFGGLIWFLLRLSMAPVMAFADNTFRFTESWKFTRRHVWKMFLVAAAFFVLSGLAYLAILGPIILGAGVDLAATGDQATRNPAQLVQSISAPWLAVGAVAFSVTTAAYYVVGMAAWAEMYRQLTPATVADTFA